MISHAEGGQVQLGLCGILTSNLERFMGLSIGILLCDEYQQ